jgi:hypothetical protein
LFDIDANQGQRQYFGSQGAVDSVAMDISGSFDDGEAFQVISM